MAFRRQIPVFLGLLAVGCIHAVRPAGSSLDGAEKEPSGELPATKVSEPTAAQPSEKAPLDLREFRPLLARPELRDVRDLVDEGKPGEAASRLNAIVEKSEPAGLESLRHAYLLGVLLEEAGDDAAALRSFETAAASPWIIHDDALLRVALLRLKAEDVKGTLQALDSLSELHDEPRALGIRAAAFDLEKDYRASAKAWRALVTKSDTASSRLALARALLSLAEAAPAGEERKSLAEEAAGEARLASLGRGEKDEQAKEAQELLKRAAASGAQVGAPLELELAMQHLRGLVERRMFEEAIDAAKEITLPRKPTFSSTRCEYDYLLGKALAGKRKWGEAADKISSAATHCTSDKELHAWLLFNAGKYSAADGRHTKAVRFYADLERLYPKVSLADDARLRAAKSYKKMGVQARFVSLLTKLPEDYPEGDMTMEGVLLLALERIERDDWSGAAQILERAAEIIRPRDSARGHEHAGTERYFLARCRAELGEEDKALDTYEEIVKEVPLSYYMLHAYSRLLEADAERAKRALAEGLERAKKSPFEFPHRAEYDSSEFARGMELLRVGETERGQNILSELGLGEGADDSLMWGIALLYDRAGDAHESHGIARGRLTDWLSHYPAGDWQHPWEIGFPRPYHSIVQRESSATGVDEWLIYGVMREESTFRPRVVSHADAYGLMQVIVPTARGIGKKSGHPYSPAALKRPSVNIAIGSRVLKELNRRFRKNPWLAIPGYNAGPGRPARWLRERPNVDFDVWVEMIPYRETRRYTKRVLASRAAYGFVYYREDAQTALVLPKRLTPP